MRWRPDVLLASGERSVWLAALLSRLNSGRWVAVGHGLEFGNSIPWQRQISRLAFSAADGVICVSNYTRRRMREMGVMPRRQKVIPNGADESFFHPIERDGVLDFRRGLGLKQEPLLLTVGNVTERKGQDNVIKALPLVLKSVPEVHYLLVGLPTLQEPLTDLARGLGVAERVHFLGQVNSGTLVAAYNACSVYVMTSRHSQRGDFEGYGIAAVEAAFCGKPAVVSSGSGLEEAVKAGETGLVVPEDDFEATAEAIIRLLNDGPLRRRLGQQARQRALKEQTWAHRVEEYDQVLKGIIKGSVGAGNDER